MNGGNGGVRRVIIHIGLHKTGTRFLRRMVLAQLDTTRFAYNPPRLIKTLRDAARHPHDPAYAERAAEQVAAWRESTDQRDLLLSEPHFSGDMYASHQDYPVILARLREWFPEATILFFVRRQSDWLQSAYRQQLVKGVGVPIEVFLNWYDGDFRPRLDRWVYGARNVEALSLRFLAIYRDYAAAYGPHNVYLLRQEDLRRRPEDVKRRVAEALRIETLPEPPVERQQNRSYSALGISLFYPGVHRRLPQPTQADTGKRPSRLPLLSKPLRRLRRLLVQHVFDRIIYRDWDLLARHGMRQRLDDHYAEENAEIERIASVILDHGPQALAAPESHRNPASPPN